jgi:DNA-directed RNA polymerase subunit RPC12/RpoP
MTHRSIDPAAVTAQAIAPRGNPYSWPAVALAAWLAAARAAGLYPTVRTDSYGARTTATAGRVLVADRLYEITASPEPERRYYVAAMPVELFERVQVMGNDHYQCTRCGALDTGTGEDWESYGGTHEGYVACTACGFMDGYFDMTAVQ